MPIKSLDVKFTKLKKFDSMKQYFVLLIFIFFLQSACASNQQEVYKHEAEVFCNLHQPERWKSRSEYTVLENFEHLNKEIKKNIHSKAFLAIFDKLATQEYDNFYETIRPEISQLIGQEWQCDAAKIFYAIKWQKVDNTKDKNEITITVLNNGEFQIQQSRYKPSEIQAIRLAIKPETNKILFKVPQNTSSEILNQYLEPLRKIGVKNLSILYY